MFRNMSYTVRISEAKRHRKNVTETKFFVTFKCGSYLIADFHLFILISSSSSKVSLCMAKILCSLSLCILSFVQQFESSPLSSSSSSFKASIRICLSASDFKFVA